LRYGDLRLPHSMGESARNLRDGAK
jgi:hypothetical protein